MAGMLAVESAESGEQEPAGTQEKEIAVGQIRRRESGDLSGCCQGLSTVVAVIQGLPAGSR